MMPAALINGRLHTKCEVCGSSASFGHGVDIHLALAAVADGRLEHAKR
jgi:hypothetical protein